MTFFVGLYILDEPEAALSPQRQLSFLRIIHDLEAPGHAPFLIATHSPILLSYPGAVLFDLDGDQIQEVAFASASPSSTRVMARRDSDAVGPRRGSLATLRPRDPSA